MAGLPDDAKESPLLSNRLIWRVTVVIGMLAVVTAAISVAGRYYGEWLRTDGYSTSTEIHHIVIGQDVLAIPENMIRFEHQRRTGNAESVDLYLLWPSLSGYEERTATVFTNPKYSQQLVFVQFSQSVMSRDMSGRLDPIYRRLFRGEPKPGPAGLTLHALDANAGFGKETILTARAKDGSTYVVRCQLPETLQAASAADCQRDVHVGKDLTLLYRFSSALLPHWEELDSKLVGLSAKLLKN